MARKAERTPPSESKFNFDEWHNEFSDFVGDAIERCRPEDLIYIVRALERWLELARFNAAAAREGCA